MDPCPIVQDLRVFDKVPSISHTFVKSWGTLFYCSSWISQTWSYTTSACVCTQTCKTFWQAETCINPLSFLPQWNMKLRAIFSQFSGAFVLCWFGNEESLLGDGWVGSASELCCCLQALYAENKWRLTTLPHQIRDTNRGAPVFHSQQAIRNGAEREVKTVWCTYTTRWRERKVDDIGLKGG